MSQPVASFPHVVSALSEDRVATAVVEAIGRISKQSPEKVPSDFTTEFGKKCGVFISSRPNLNQLFSLRYEEHPDGVFQINVSTLIADYPRRIENLAYSIFSMMRKGIVVWQTPHGECRSAYGPPPNPEGRKNRRRNTRTKYDRNRSSLKAERSGFACE